MTGGGGDDRRHAPRVRVDLIVRVEGDEDGGARHWADVTATADASDDGVSFAVDHPVTVGQLVRLQLLPPLPKALGHGDLAGPTPEAWAVVRNVRQEGGVYKAGVQFLDAPPPGAAPAESGPAERRHDERFKVPASFLLQQVDDLGAILKEGLTVAEDISRGGAQLVTEARLSKGDVVLLQEMTGTFSGRGEVLRAWIDADGLRRIHVRFLDGRSPDPVIPRER